MSNATKAIYDPYPGVRYIVQRTGRTYNGCVEVKAGCEVLHVRSEDLMPYSFEEITGLTKSQASQDAIGTPRFRKEQ